MTNQFEVNLNSPINEKTYESIIPEKFKISKKECIHGNISSNGLIRIFDPIHDKRVLYNGALSVLNGILPVAFFSFHDNKKYERDLVNTLNSNNVKAIQLIENLWIIYKDDMFKLNAMYILSLFSNNPVDYDVSNRLAHLLKYYKNGINPYDYILGLMMGFPTRVIRGIILHNYILHKYQNVDNIDSIFFDADKFDNLVFKKSLKMYDSDEIILFDAMFDFVSSECDKMFEYLFSASSIFKNFVKTNSKFISTIPLPRIEISVLHLKDPKIKDLLEKKNYQKIFRSSNKSSYKSPYSSYYNTQPSYTISSREYSYNDYRYNGSKGGLFSSFKNLYTPFGF